MHRDAAAPILVASLLVTVLRVRDPVPSGLRVQGHQDPGRDMELQAAAKFGPGGGFR